MKGIKRKDGGRGNTHCDPRRLGFCAWGNKLCASWQASKQDWSPLSPRSLLCLSQDSSPLPGPLRKLEKCPHRVCPPLQHPPCTLRGHMARSHLTPAHSTPNLYGIHPIAPFRIAAPPSILPWRLPSFQGCGGGTLHPCISPRGNSLRRHQAGCSVSAMRAPIVAGLVLFIASNAAGRVARGSQPPAPCGSWGSKAQKERGACLLRGRGKGVPGGQESSLSLAAGLPLPSLPPTLSPSTAGGGSPRSWGWVGRMSALLEAAGRLSFTHTHTSSHTHMFSYTHIFSHPFSLSHT